MIRRLILALYLIFTFISCQQKKYSPNLKTELSGFSGEKHAYLINLTLDDDASFLVADTIRYFTGEYAEKAYFEDHGQKLSETTFYIRNKDKDSLNFPVSDTVKIITQTLEYNQDGSYKSNAELSLVEINERFNMKSNSNLSYIPFRIYFNKGKIIKIEEIYLP